MTAKEIFNSFSEILLQDERVRACANANFSPIFYNERGKSLLLAQMDILPCRPRLEMRWGKQSDSGPLAYSEVRSFNVCWKSMGPQRNITSVYRLL